VTGPLRIDGSGGEGGGQILRTALTLSAITGQPFAIDKIRARRVRPGLRPQHLAAIRAATLACGADVHGAFEGSPDLRFSPGSVKAGRFRFEIETAGAASLVLQTVLPILATADEPSQVEVTGGTHVPASPSASYLRRHWAAVVARLGLRTRIELVRAGFYPRGGGELRAVVEPWARGQGLSLEQRGAFVGLAGESGAGRLKGNVARRQRDAAEARFWEEKRWPAAWDVLDAPSASPGSFLLVEAIFETGRLAIGFLGEKGMPAEQVGDRAARHLLKLIEASDSAVDGHLADQLVVPISAAGGGGRVTTCEVTRHLETVAETARLFGFDVRVTGRRGGPGAVEVARV